MSFVIVPNELRDAIYAKIDPQLESLPLLKDKREEIYSQLLSYYDDHGKIPDFNIEPVNAGPEPLCSDEGTRTVGEKNDK